MDFHLDYMMFIRVCTTLLCCLFLQTGEVAAQTYKHEVGTLKIVAEKLGKVDWNFSVDPCTGKAGKISDNNAFQGLGCVCSSHITYNICHVTNITLPSQNLRGVLPPELANLTHLQGLDLTDNSLSGLIPPQLGSLTLLKNLSLSRNLLFGPIPKELSNLRSLIELVLHSNHLSGTLPAELENLTNLEKLHLSSNWFIGDIPSTFCHLKNLIEFRASSNDFTGSIPSCIGSLTKLETLVLQGTSMEGPIPSTISNLAQMKDLRISDITQGGSALEFIPALRNLRILVLRNSFISGEIPQDIEALNKLETLDLSFNNLVGRIPDSLDLLPNLQFLFLGNNNLIGQLPSWLSESKAVIDLSYNKLSGFIPSMLADEGSKVNLIGNYLNIRFMDHSPLACLQRNFSCSKHAPNHQLAINCGGSQLKTFAPSHVFDEDNAQLGGSSIYWSHRKNWGVCNIGYFMDAEPQSKTQYIVESNISISSAIRPHENGLPISVIEQQLYKTARISPASLRYYGLGLQNGPYRVELHFAERQFPVNKTSRIFDIYIQGIKVLKDFNLKEAAREQNLVVVKNFTVNVTENILEIHFFWAGKGTCCDPRDGTYGASISAIIVTPEFKPIVPKKTKTIILVIIIAESMALLGLLLIAYLAFIKKKNIYNIFSCTTKDKAEGSPELKSKDNVFSLRMMKIATEDFDPRNKLGEGGFGAVYKGVLPGGNVVAIKQFCSQSKQGNREFLNEVAMISALQHPNLVKLYGCCVEGEELLLVYEYMEKNSLAHALFGPNEGEAKLDWPTRYKICLGIARGLAYLHESLLRIVHRDIKSTNILLDKHLTPKIGDFGLARQYDDEETHQVTIAAGTIGYMAPEYAFKGHLTDKADVYSFGVVILEVVSGRRHRDMSLEDERAYLLEWAWQLYEEKKMLNLVDGKLNSRYNEEEVLRMINVGLCCTHDKPSLRPSMSAIVEMLESKAATPSPQYRPAYLS